MKLAYSFSKFIKVYKFNLKNKFVDIKNFHRIELSDAVMVIAEYKSKFLFIKEYRIGLKKFSWGLPGGFIEKHETAKKAGIREFKEETNINLNNLNYVAKFIRNGNYFCGIDHVYYAKLDKIKIPKFEQNVKHIWLTKKEINEYIKKRKFETPGIIAGLHYFFKK